MSDDDEEQGGGLLAGFLFGNIDEAGNLENDILDDVSFVMMLSMVKGVIFLLCR